MDICKVNRKAKVPKLSFPEEGKRRRRRKKNNKKKQQQPGSGSA